MLNNIKKFVLNSFFMDNIDNIAYCILLLTLFISLFCQSDFLGMGALFFSFIVLFKIIFKKTSFKIETYEKAYIVYFLIVIVSLLVSFKFISLISLPFTIVVNKTFAISFSFILISFSLL